MVGGCLPALMEALRGCTSGMHSVNASPDTHGHPIHGNRDHASATLANLPGGRLARAVYSGVPDQRVATGKWGWVVKVSVDHNRCEGYSRCQSAAPEVFEVRDDDLSHVLQDQPPESLRPKVERAVRLCPRQAVILTESEW